MVLLLSFSALFLAFANGANDNFKGFATVWGSRSLNYRKALFAATLATIGGSLMSLFFAQDLVRRFSGKGLVPDTVVADPAFVTSAGLGAAVTVMIATRLGMPISTTHALLGGLIGAGVTASNSGIDLGALGSGFVLPLLISPVLAATLGLVAYLFIRTRRAAAPDCVCIGDPVAAVTADGATLKIVNPSPAILLAQKEDCDLLPPSTIRVSVPLLLDRVHILSATAICFARGVNDTPKLAALLIAANVTGLRMSVALITLLMTVGALLMARRVAETMSHRINQIDATQGVSANVITAALILLASRFGLPVSTTHVSVGSIAGVGAGAGTLDWSALRSVLLSWVATLPCAAAIAWLVAAALK
ncbi:MAG: inorganic phosphate transporter [Sphingomicrobium sp.]